MTTFDYDDALYSVWAEEVDTEATWQDEEDYREMFGPSWPPADRAQAWADLCSLDEARYFGELPKDLEPAWADAYSLSR